MHLKRNLCVLFDILPFYFEQKRNIDKKLSGKSKEEQMVEKKQELEKRLQDVTGQLGSAKKAAKKGKHLVDFTNLSYRCLQIQIHIITKSVIQI